MQSKCHEALLQPTRLHQHFSLSDSHSVSREAEPVEDENLQGEEEEEEQMDEEYTEMISEEGESPVTFSYEEGSGGYEGSAFDVLMADRSATAESETGSGESWTVTDNDKGNLSVPRPPSSLYLPFSAPCSLTCPCFCA